jgi:hypothetical protein
MDGVLFKIDFEKAYDKVKWNFLKQALCMKGFPLEWCNWVARFFQGGTLGIRDNRTLFSCTEWYRQGNPFSPILFNIVIDMLAILISWVKANRHLGGLVTHLVEGEISIL